MEKAQSKEPTTNPITLSEFKGSLQRLFKIGIYYPSGHAILDRATERFMEHLVEVAGEKSSVILEVYNTTLILEGIELDNETPFVREFNTMLSTLGVSALIIDRQITMRELHDFVRKMLAYKAKVLNAKKFAQVEITNLPHSITVEQKEFLARSDIPARQDDSDDGPDDLNSFVESLSNYGLNDGEILQCKMLLDSLPDQLSGSSIEMSDLPYASWDDVANLLARVIRGGAKKDKNGKVVPPSHSNINALASILKKLELETHDKKSREAINLIVAIIKKPFQENAGDKEEIPRKIFPDKPTLSINQIQNFTDQKKLNPKILSKISDAASDNETLSILMQLARFEQALPSQIRMQQLFRELLAGSLTEKTWEILSAGVHEIIQDGKVSRIASIVRIILEPLRRSVHTNTLIFFQHISRLCNDQELVLLWPHIVNEILVIGSSNDKLVFHQLCQVAARMTHEQMTGNLQQLRSLESFQDNKIASDIFHAVSPSCYPLFAFLLKTEIERYVGDRVVGGLKRNPKDWLIKAVAPLLDMSIQDHKLFLYSYLRQASQKVLSEPLKNIASRIIVDSLPSLSQDRRNEHWVENTITAMAQLRSEQTTELLNKIASGKKMLFIPDWPATCRKAAEAALAGGNR